MHGIGRMPPESRVVGGGGGMRRMDSRTGGGGGTKFKQIFLHIHFSRCFAKFYRQKVY